MNERLVHFGVGNSLVGTLTLPGGDGAPVREVAFVFVNAGFVHRVGPHRLHVRAARFFARFGYPAMRFDFSGIGDSPRLPGDENQAVRQSKELQAALNIATAETGARQFVLVGLCSGTDPCIAAAMQDSRVAGVVLIDPFAYRTLRSWVRHVAQRARAQVSLLAALRAIVHRLRPRSTTGEFIVRSVPPKADFQHWFATMLQRKVHVFTLYSGNFHAWYNYPTQFTDAHGTFQNSPYLHLEYVPEANHTFTELPLQNALLERIRQWTERL